MFRKNRDNIIRQLTYVPLIGLHIGTLTIPNPTYFSFHIYPYLPRFVVCQCVSFFVPCKLRYRCISLNVRLVIFNLCKKTYFFISDSKVEFLIEKERIFFVA